jgi:hypothetical protein
MISGILLSLIFVALSLVHGYWVVAETGDLSGFVPETAGKPAFSPGRFVTSVVAMLLLLAAAICVSQARLLGVPRVPVARVGVWALLVLFLLRAVGEFNLIGFFKRVRDTRFGRLDTWVYSPLCLVVSALCAALLYSTR